MGWTFQKRGERMSDREFFTKEFPSCNIVDMSAPIHGVIYMVLENKKKLGDLFAVVVEVKWDRRSNWDFGYKDIEECMGPYQHECPIRLLNLLSPTDDATSNEWRKACYENAKRISDGRKRARQLKPGAKIQFPTPMKFSDRTSHSEFIVEQHGRKRLFRAVDNHGLYQIRCIEKKEFHFVQNS